jgi:hypothetical protein
MLAHHVGGVFVAGRRDAAGLRGSKVEPQAGRRGDRQHAGADAALVHVLEHLVAAPGHLAREVRLFVRVFVAKPELLVFGWIEMDVGVDQVGF